MARLIVSALTVLLLVSCAKGKLEYDEFVSSSRHSEKINLHYDSDVPRELKDIVDLDLELMSRMKVTGTAEDAALFNVRSFDGPAWNNFVRAGFRHLVPESFKITESNFYGSESGRTLRVIEERGALESIKNLFFNLTPEGPAGATNASYISASVWDSCGPKGYLCGLVLSDGTRVDHVSAQGGGIVKAGEGLLMARAGGDKLSRANLGFVAATLSHEVGHGISNGSNRCLLHPVCPSWHAYAGDYSCDNVANGNYARGARILELVRLSCGTKCTEAQKQKMDVGVADYRDRTLPNSPTVDLRAESL